MHREIALQCGLILLIDDCDWESASRLSWYGKRAKNTTYAERILTNDGVRSTILMHRWLMSAAPGTEVDHRNGNGLDNRRLNLRIATHAQNQQNSSKQRRLCRSRFKGVCWSNAAGKWLAYIGIDRKQRHLGCFVSETEAAVAYDVAAIAAFGEFARLNFPGTKCG